MEKAYQPNAGTSSVRQLTPVALQGKCTSSRCLAGSQVPLGDWFWFIYLSIEPFLGVLYLPRS